MFAIMTDLASNRVDVMGTSKVKERHVLDRILSDGELGVVVVVR